MQGFFFFNLKISGMYNKLVPTASVKMQIKCSSHRSGRIHKSLGGRRLVLSQEDRWTMGDVLRKVRGPGDEGGDI